MQGFLEKCHGVVKPESYKEKAFVLNVSCGINCSRTNSARCIGNIVEFPSVPQPDPNQPKPEGRQMTPVKGEPLGVVCNWPPALEAALQRWGTTQAKCPCLTALDVTGKPVYTLTYGELSPSFHC